MIFRSALRSFFVFIRNNLCLTGKIISLFYINLTKKALSLTLCSLFNRNNMLQSKYNIIFGGIIIDIL